MVRKRASFLAVLATAPMLLCAAPARAASAVDDALVLWDWIARSIATMARCADYDLERREQHLDVMEQYFNDVKDAQAKIEAVLVRDAVRAGSRNAAREITKRMDDSITRARAEMDAQNQGHDIRFVKSVCRALPDEYSGGTTLFLPLAERFPKEILAVGKAAS